MSRDEEANQYFRAATDAQLDDWLAGADPNTHPQYQRALLEKRRREKQENNQIKDQHHREIRRDNGWMIWLAALGVLATILIGMIRNKTITQSSTFGPAATSNATPTVQSGPVVSPEPMQSPNFDLSSPAGIELSQKPPLSPKPQSTATPEPSP